ncbi:hypothetical protein SAMN02745124_02178 [Desulfofustis glycolicus DSM 9705]|uniref:Uncharacterized protein n=1 Tax=Desulfofustis glycolicus DSM 9705 TaxID=1121409 RepID=A0A1M5W9K7_9BACT|nr:hypothetical protein SAMN02745124_02178 [Desulfofustis glycolicus DSM 9705]
MDYLKQQEHSGMKKARNKTVMWEVVQTQRFHWRCVNKHFDR